MILSINVRVHDKIQVSKSNKKTDFLDFRTIFHLNDAKQNKMLKKTPLDKDKAMKYWIL